MKEYKASPNNTLTEFSLSSYLDSNSKDENHSIKLQDKILLNSITFDDQVKKRSSNDKMDKFKMTQIEEETQNDYDKQFEQLKIKKTSSSPDGPRKGTGFFFSNDDEDVTLQKSEILPTKVTQALLTITSPAYIYHPENEGVIIEMMEDSKQSELQTPKLLQDQVQRETIETKKQVIIPTLKKSQTLFIPPLTNRYVSDASSNHSQDLNRITERSDMAGSEDSFIDFFQSKSNVAPPGSNHGGRGARGSLISIKSSSDSCSKQTLTTLPAKSNYKSDDLSIMKTQSLFIPKQINMEENMMEKTLQQDSFQYPSLFSRQTTQKEAILYETFGDAPGGSKTMIDNKYKLLDLKQVDNVIQAQSTVLNNLLLPKYKPDHYKLIQQMPIVKLSQSSNMESSKGGNSTRIVNDQSHWMNQSHIYEQKNDKGSIQFLNPSASLKASSHTSPNASPKFIHQPSFSPIKNIEPRYNKFTLIEDDQRQEQAQRVLTYQIMAEQSNPKSQGQFQKIQRQPYSPSPQAQEKPLVSIADIFANLKPMPYANNLKTTKNTPPPQIHINSQIDKYKDLSFNISENEMIFERQSTAKQIQSIQTLKDSPVRIKQRVQGSNDYHNYSPEFVTNESGVLSNQKSSSSLYIKDLSLKSSVVIDSKSKTPREVASSNVSSQYVFNYDEILLIQNLGPQQVQNHSALLEENYQQYVDLDKLPTYSRNHLLESKINSIRQLQDSQRQLLNVSKSPVVNRSKSMVNVNRMTEQQHNNFGHTIITNTSQEKSPANFNVIIRSSNNPDIKLLFQNEWWGFDIHFHQYKVNQNPKELSKRAISPHHPDNLLRKIYNEYKMIPKERVRQFPYSDYDVKISKQIQIESRLHSKNNKKPLQINLHFEGHYRHDLIHKNDYQDLLTQLGHLLNNQYIKQLDHQLSQEIRLKNNKHQPEKQVEGFNLKYLLQALRLIYEQLMQRDCSNLFKFQQCKNNEYIFDFSPPVQDMTRIPKQIHQVIKTDISSYEYYEEVDEQSYVKGYK